MCPGRKSLVVTMVLIWLTNENFGDDQQSPADSSTEDRYITLIHGSTTVRLKENTMPYPAFLDPELTVLSVDRLPDAASMPTIGNGHLATVVHSDTMYMNGLYNGEKGSSHRARLQSTSSVNITGFSFRVNSTKFSLDLARGMYVEEYTSDDVRVELRMYAHQWNNRLLVTEISVLNQGMVPVHLNLSQNLGPISDDVDVQTGKTNSSDQFRLDYGMTKESEVYGDVKREVVVISSLVPESITIDAGANVRYLFQTCVESQLLMTFQLFQKGIDGFLNGTLTASHVHKWEEIWREGRIDMGGNREMGRINYAGLYYLLSEIPSYESYGHFFGISPGGLAHGGLHKDYQGHIFWDQETWMFPPVLALHSDQGKKIVKARLTKHTSAKQNARSRGYQGAMYPWESAYTGLEVCPLPQYSEYEQHITGDVALAIKQYVMMTRDTHFLEHEGGADVIDDIASFWMSRLTFNEEDERYELYGDIMTGATCGAGDAHSSGTPDLAFGFCEEVMPPDEYHYPVNNSAYTNAVAKISLLLPKYVASLTTRTPNPQFEESANQIYIPYNDTGKWHPEYDGYTPDEAVKQADVVLLGYPLMADVSEDIRRSDLELYERVTIKGPAMTWGMFAIGWLELNNTSKAELLFKKQFDNVVPPFNIWSEVVHGEGARNFLTGIGGYLQSVIYGYGGFRIFEDKLQFNPNMPPNTTTFNLTGIDYLGGSFDFSFDENRMLITQSRRAAEDMMSVLASTGENRPLDIGVEIQWPRGKAYLIPVNVATQCHTCNGHHTTPRMHRSGSCHIGLNRLVLLCIFLLFVFCKVL